MHVQLMNVLMITKSEFYNLICSEIQLKSPNWLFGQRKYEENVSASKAATGETANCGSHIETGFDGFCNLDMLSLGDIHEEDIFQR